MSEERRIAANLLRRNNVSVAQRKRKLGTSCQSSLSKRLSVSPCGAPYNVRRWSVAIWSFGLMNSPLLPVLKIPLPALNDGAGIKRLFVVDRSDRRG